MIRFIDLTGQIIDGETDFAWYDTVTDKFLSFSGNQTWNSWDDFVTDYNPDETFPLSRFRDLFRTSLTYKKLHEQ